MATRRKVEVVKKKGRGRPVWPQKNSTPMRASMLAHVERQCKGHRNNCAAQQLLALRAAEDIQ